MDLSHVLLLSLGAELGHLRDTRASAHIHSRSQNDAMGLETLKIKRVQREFATALALGPSRRIPLCWPPNPTKYDRGTSYERPEFNHRPLRVSPLDQITKAKEGNTFHVKIP